MQVFYEIIPMGTGKRIHSQILRTFRITKTFNDKKKISRAKPEFSRR
jgi:hypothetical protein